MTPACPVQCWGMPPEHSSLAACLHIHADPAGRCRARQDFTATCWLHGCMARTARALRTLRHVPYSRHHAGSKPTWRRRWRPQSCQSYVMMATCTSATWCSSPMQAPQHRSLLPTSMTLCALAARPAAPTVSSVVPSLLYQAIGALVLVVNAMAAALRTHLGIVSYAGLLIIDSAACRTGAPASMHAQQQRHRRPGRHVRGTRCCLPSTTQSAWTSARRTTKTQCCAMARRFASLSIPQ
jgi:hypothetical protein